MLRKYFIQKNIHYADLHHVIGHNASIYTKVLLRTVWLLVLLYIVFAILSGYVKFAYLPRLFWVLWILWFVKFVVDFMNLYLDGLALSSDWLTLFMREWLMEYKTEYFDRDKVVKISHNQKWFRDKVLQRWDIIINLEQWIQFPFENVTSPKKQVDKIMRLKNYHAVKNNHEAEEETNEESSGYEDPKFNILVEALSEVVKDYIDKKDKDVENEKFKSDFF